MEKSRDDREKDASSLNAHDFSVSRSSRPRARRDPSRTRARELSDAIAFGFPRIRAEKTPEKRAHAP
jgi:hypothetical protein|eukprot:28779-Pelagococcus_subviridis.AAC.1